MNLSQWPIFKAGLFRQAKYLVSTPQKAQKVLAITEIGAVGIQLLPMETGFMKFIEGKKAWAAVHALKYQLYKNGKPTEHEAAMVISERSYIPLDPLNTLKEKDREKLASLKDIAKIRHAQARAVAAHADNHKDIASLIVQSSFILLAVFAVITLARGC
jgi:hypothetical protein